MGEEAGKIRGNSWDLKGGYLCKISKQKAEDRVRLWG